MQLQDAGSIPPPPPEWVLWWWLSWRCPAAVCQLECLLVSLPSSPSKPFLGSRLSQMPGPNPCKFYMYLRGWAWHTRKKREAAKGMQRGRGNRVSCLGFMVHWCWHWQQRERRTPDRKRLQSDAVLPHDMWALAGQVYVCAVHAPHSHCEPVALVAKDRRPAGSLCQTQGHVWHVYACAVLLNQKWGPHC